ncbi:MAG: hypothetical protein KAX49_03565 [Halanaerobiales bacterium]|nr:hypothetical protein [Halanaerobiales bacterium]
MKKKFFLCLLVFLLMFFVSGCGLPEPDEAAQLFLSRLINEQYEEMYQMLTNEIKAEMTSGSFASYYRNFYDKLGKTRLTLEMVKPNDEKWDIQDNRVRIPIEGMMLTWRVGDLSMNQTLKMIYEEKEWRIDWQPRNIFPQLTNLNHQLEITRTTAQRGGIYDRLGYELAGLGKIYQIGMVPGKMENWDASINTLSELLDLSPAKIEKTLQQKWVRLDLFVPLRSITNEEWLSKRDDLLEIPGLLASSSESRVYYSPYSLAQTIGYLGEINQNELKDWEKEGYEVGDWVGRAGLEEKFEKTLAGKPGYMIRIVDENGKEQLMIKFTRSMNGNDLFLTIDKTLQQIAESAMAERRGVVIAMAPQTGEVLTLASFPGYDGNEFLFGRSSTRLKEILNDPFSPLLNRTIQGKYIPGSTFKPLTVLAALELVSEYDFSKKVEIPEDTWRAESGWGSYRVKRVSRPVGPVDLYGAMKWSDNIYFAQLAYQIGSEHLFTISERVGFEEQIPFALDVATSSLSSSRPIANSILLADSGYGQGQILMTPLHIAMIYSAIATDGKIRQPVILSNEEQGSVWKDAIGTIENIDLLQDVLKVTVQDEEAFAHKANIPQLDMAGKTGTAQIENGKEMGWFVCYHPVQDPEFLLLVGIEDAKHGSKEAIEVAREILLEYYQINIDKKQESATKEENI